MMSNLVTIKKKVVQKLCLAPSGGTGYDLESKPVNVKWGDNLREGKILCNRPGNSYLVDGQIRIWCNNSSSRKVNSFPHQISSDTSFFALQSLFN